MTRPPDVEARPGSRGLGGWLRGLAVVLAAQALSFVVMPHVPLRGLAGFAVAFALVVAAVLGTAARAPVVSTRWAMGLVPAAAGLGGLARVAPGSDAALVVLVVTAILIGGGTLLGAIVGARVRKPGYLMVVAYVSSLADLYSVFSPAGVSAAVAESEELLAVLAVSWPLPGTRVASPLLGVGDIVMSAVYLVASRQLGLGAARTGFALAVAYAVVALLLIVLGRALPALPVLGVAVVLAHPEVRTLPREDRATAIAGATLLTLLFALLGWGAWF